MSIAKIPVILILGIGLHVSASSPNPAIIAKAERRLRDGGVNIFMWLLIVKLAYWAHVFIEVVIILGAHWCSESSAYKQIVAYLLPHGQIFLSPATVIATGFGAMAGVIRYVSYRELGRCFTFHVTILKEHKLITTGPYGMVRHPAYLGWILLYPAMAMHYTAPGSWLGESGIYTRKEAWLFIFPVLTAWIILLGVMLNRLEAEDKVLKKEFGKEWEAWAGRVRYKLVPGLY